MQLTQTTETVTQTIEVQEERFVLSLTRDEAETLVEISMSVGGDPNGRRGHMDDIRGALIAAGVERGNELRDNQGRGSIYFADREVAA